MPVTHACRSLACALALCAAFALTAPAVWAESPFDEARRLYLNAEYENALSRLTALHGTTTAEQTEISTYAVFCLIALGRTQEATRTIESIVSADPFYLPAADIASPRVTTTFRLARRAALPGVIRREYAAAKLAFDRKDPASTAMFERVLRLLADSDVDEPGTADLRLLAGGFRDLSRAFAPVAPAVAEASPPPAAAAPPPATATAPQASPAAAPDPLTLRPAREGDAGVVPPVVISQTLPPWNPINLVGRTAEYSGVIEVVIDQRGSVIAATMRASVHPQYDQDLLRAARGWKYRPAVKDGTPLAYTKLVEVRLRPPAR